METIKTKNKYLMFIPGIKHDSAFYKMLVKDLKKTKANIILLGIPQLTQVQIYEIQESKEESGW